MLLHEIILKKTGKSALNWTPVQQNDRKSISIAWNLMNILSPYTPARSWRSEYSVSHPTPKVCVGYQKFWYIPLRIVVCTFSHPTHQHDVKSTQWTILLPRVCVGCQIFWYIPLHMIVCTFSHPTHQRDVEDLSTQWATLLPRACVGCQIFWYIPLHIIVCARAHVRRVSESLNCSSDN